MTTHGEDGDTEAEAVVAEYGEWMRSWNASPRTIKARQTLALSRLREWGLDDFTADNITAFLARPKLKSKWSRATYHAHLTDLCAWMVTKGYLTSDPMAGVRVPMRPKSKPHPLLDHEVTLVLDAATGRVRDWILLALLAGLRSSEIAAIRGEDVDADGIYIPGKGDTKETLPCHPDLWDMAQRYPRSGFWFPGSEDGHIPGQRISLQVGNLFRPLGISGSVHRCRHVYGTRLLRSGTNIRVVQKLMRHANLDTTAAYTAVDEDELRAAINLLGPVA